MASTRTGRRSHPEPLTNARPRPTALPYPPGLPQVVGHNKTPEGTAAYLGWTTFPVQAPDLLSMRASTGPPWLLRAPPGKEKDTGGGWREGSALSTRFADRRSIEVASPQAVHAGRVNGRAGATADVLATHPEQLVEDLPEGIHDQRQMAVLSEEMRSRGWVSHWPGARTAGPHLACRGGRRAGRRQVGRPATGRGSGRRGG
jgi:hypothetical protein